MKHTTDNSIAAGSTITMISVFLLSCVLFILIGFGIDKVIMASLNFQSILASSQMRYDVIKVMLMAFEFEPFIILFGAVVNVWVVSSRSQSGESDLSGMLVAASEMLLLTLGVVALTTFGGLAIESVIGVMNNLVLTTTTQPGLYSAVVYIAPVFYGLCVLGLFGVIIQFIMTCVQTVDYSQSY